MAEKCNIGIGDVAVGNAAATAVADVMGGEQVFLIGFEQRAVGGGRFPAASAER